MNANDALVEFLSRSLSEKRERYLEFVLKPKRRPDFLEALHHEVIGCLNRHLAVQDFAPKEWSRPAFLFCPPDSFGQPIPALKDADTFADDAFLAVAEDGSLGWCREETIVDSQLFIRLEQR